MVTYLNRGMYDVVEAARLVRVSPNTIVDWAYPKRNRPALVEPSLKNLYSFLDLISLHIVATLSKRDVRLKEIAIGVQSLRVELGTEWPLAHRELATVGRAFFAQGLTKQEWVDVGKGGQLALQELVEPEIRKIEYGPDYLATIWRPQDRIWLNPRVQAGASCIDSTRIPTSTIWSIVESGDHPLDVASDYDLQVEDVMAALEFEKSLSKVA